MSFSLENPKASTTNTKMSKERQMLTSENITLGPIVGAVTDTTARIMVELPISYISLKVRLVSIKKTLITVPCDNETEKSGGLFNWFSSKSSTKQKYSRTLGNEIVEVTIPLVEANKPYVVTFDNLKPNTRYQFGFHDPWLAEEQVECFVHTLKKDNIDPIKFAVVSCNFPTRVKPEESLWNSLLQRIKEADEGDDRISMLLHTGDEIYADYDIDKAGYEYKGSVHDKCLTLVKEKGLENITQDDIETMKDWCRELYRRVWGEGVQRKVMAMVPNYMVADDHEYINNVSFDPINSDPTTPEHFVIKIQREIYREYQVQLREDISQPINHRNTHEGYVLDQLHKHIHWLWLDLRVGSVFSDDKSKPMLGTTQWKMVTDWFEQNQNSEVKTLFLVIPVPLFFLSECVCEHLLKFSDNITDLKDLQDQWTTRQHEAEQLELIRLMEQWKKGKPNREVVVLSGDLHCGLNSSLYDKDGKLVCRQLTSSGITNEPAPFFATLGMRVLSSVSDKICDDYNFVHHSWVTKQNYGIVGVSENNRIDLQLKSK
jgi:phosphodiesterase/alkaline phosphatase D-like protein